jgi:hypothetical protein
VAEWSGSGLTQAEFCRRKKIHPMTFCGWKYRFPPGSPAAASVTRPKGAGLFVPVIAEATPAATAACHSSPDLARPIEILLRNGRVVRATAGIAPAVLARLVSALEG